MRRLDVSDLEAPEPLLRTLAACEDLTAGEFVLMLHRMHPCLLYDRLAERDLASLTEAPGPEAAVEVYIWRLGDRDAEQAARALAADRRP